MPLVISGPLCLGCGGNRVVKRYFWEPIAWTTAGEIKGYKERSVCLNCDGERVGQKFMTYPPMSAERQAKMLEGTT
jgi:hypothetical protein